MPERYDKLDQLQDKNGEILVKGALYRKFIYTGKGRHFTNQRAVNSPRFGLVVLPSKLDTQGLVF